MDCQVQILFAKKENTDTLNAYFKTVTTMGYGVTTNIFDTFRVFRFLIPKIEKRANFFVFRLILPQKQNWEILFGKLEEIIF